MRPEINYKRTPEEKLMHIEKGIDKCTVRFNAEERLMLDKAKKILCVDRDSTALKELAYIGSNVLHGHLFGEIVPRIVKRIKKGYYDLV